MNKLIVFATLTVLIAGSPGLARSARAQSVAVDYLVETAVKYYNNGAVSDARHEFKKALMVDPRNKVALEYLQKIEQALPARVPPLSIGYTQPAPHKRTISPPPERDMLISETLDRLSEGTHQPPQEQRYAYSPSYQMPPSPAAIARPQPAETQKAAGEAPFILSGDIQLAGGVEDGDFIAKQANFDLNEKNWRMQSTDAFNRKENTFDPAIYDRLRVAIDTPKDHDGFGFHTDISVDPWAFTGKSDPLVLIGEGGDKAVVEMKYWANTGYTLNETVYTLQNGDSFNLPEIKVKDGKTVPTTIITTWGNIITIPETKIHRDFQPVRELWVDYKQDDYLKVRVFPLATEAQAYSSDDPLKLSNNHIFWEESPWIRAWKKGNYNAGAFPVSFSKGYWDNSLSYMARDSSGVRLTALRGLSFDMKPTDNTAFSTTWASPKNPWQEYSDADNVSGAMRFTEAATDNFKWGATYTMRFGLVDDKKEVDSRNTVIGIDATYEIVEGTKFSAEVARSDSKYDMTDETFESQSRGNAYYFSAVARYPGKPIRDTVYEGILPETNEPFMSKIKFFASHMDKGFDPALASYRQTRRDSFWSRHLHFRQPLDYFYAGLFNPPMKIDDIKPFAIGNGIDIGRDAVGLRWEAAWDHKVDNLFDIRNVRSVEGKYIETVTRDEIAWKVNDRLTAKALGIYQDMPRTKAGVDPFLYNPRTGDYLTDWSADPIDEGKDPSLKTGSVGLDYAVTDWLSVNGIYEYTNDYTLAYDNFPRGILNSAQPSFVYGEYGNTYLRNRDFLYDQQYFPQPPYEFYNIFKVGTRILPMEKVELYFDYTRNEFEKAGQISDSMNHIGAEIGYLPTDKLGFYLRYTYSRWDDLERVVQGITKTKGHHNIFAAMRYRMSADDEFILEYGVSPNYSVLDSVTNDPFGGSLATIDTQHIIRFFYRRKF